MQPWLPILQNREEKYNIAFQEAIIHTNSPYHIAPLYRAWSGIIVKAVYGSCIMYTM